MTACDLPPASGESSHLSAWSQARSQHGHGHCLSMLSESGEKDGSEPSLVASGCCQRPGSLMRACLRLPWGHRCLGRKERERRETVPSSRPGEGGCQGWMRGATAQLRNPRC